MLILNSDGIPLTDSDIIYSKMFAAAKNENDRKVLGEKWRYLIDITNKLESNKIVSINALLSQKMYLYRSINKDTINEIGNIDVTTPGLRRYYTEINSTLIKNPLDFCAELIKLAEIWNIVKDNNSMKVLFNFNDNSKLFLASFFYRYDSYFGFDNEGKINISDENKASLIKETEKIIELMLRLFAILSLVDAGYSSSNFKSFLFIEEIQNDFNEHINKHWTKDEIKTKLYDYEKNDIVYLNEYLFAKEKNRTLFISTDIDIEHIMP